MNDEIKLVRIQQLKSDIKYVVERLNTALKYGDDMKSSTELAAKDALYILTNSVKFFDENKTKDLTTNNGELK